MALNCVMFDDKRNPIPLPNEMTVLTIDSGVDLVLQIPDNGKTAKSLKASGRLWITDQRFLFASSSPSTLESLSIPLHSILSTKFEQPTFGSNYLLLEVLPSPDGGLTTGTTLEVRIKNQAMFQFVALLEKTRERAIYMKREAIQETYDGPPRYDSPVGTTVHLAGSTSATAAEPPAPADNPPAYGI